VCPQHDILWDDLTIEEHLLFYARIKGIPPEKEQEAVQKAMDTVSLTKYKNSLSKNLSGGEKRRLSIAIALIGDGKVVFLDEPTTGLDPEVRRLIWDIINNAKSGRTIILTTHSMEEAEVLCQKIGIMARGTLRCLGVAFLSPFPHFLFFQSDPKITFPFPLYPCISFSSAPGEVEEQVR